MILATLASGTRRRFAGAGRDLRSVTRERGDGAAFEGAVCWQDAFREDAATSIEPVSNATVSRERLPMKGSPTSALPVGTFTARAS